MRECGEDLLVDMSEVLFNELAFFRLMQDLDDPLIAEKMQQAQYGSEEEVRLVRATTFIIVIAVTSRMRDIGITCLAAG